MFNSNLRSIWTVIKQDWDIYPFKSLGRSCICLLINALTGKSQSFTYLFWFRLSTKPNIFYPIARWMHYRLSRSYGVYIPTKTNIGNSCIIWHSTGIVINPRATIGHHCQIHQFVSIGEYKGRYPTIGNNVYIGPNVSIVGGVKIGNNVKIGAGTVVINDVPDNATTVGNPNRIILN